MSAPRGSSDAPPPTSARAEPPLSASAPLLLVALCSFTSNLAARVTDPMLPLIADQFAVTPQYAAWLATAYGLPFALAQPILGPVADAFGKSAVIKICLALLTMSFACCAVAPSFGALFLARSLSGAVAGGIFPVAIALVADRVAYESRQVALSRLVIAAITGQMMGAALSGAISTYAGWRTVFVVTSLFAACVSITAFARLRDDDKARRRFSLRRAATDYASILKDGRARIVYGTVLCEGLLMFGVFPFVAPTLLSRGQGGTFAAGLCVAAYALGGALYGASAKPVVAYLGPWRMMAIGGLLVGACYGLIALPAPWPVVATLFVFAGFGFYLLHNTMQTISTELAPHARGSAVALLAAFFYLGQALGPTLSGQISAVGGYATMFVTDAALMAITGIVSSRLLRRNGTTAVA